MPAADHGAATLSGAGGDELYREWTAYRRAAGLQPAHSQHAAPLQLQQQQQQRNGRVQACNGDVVASDRPADGLLGQTAASGHMHRLSNEEEHDGRTLDRRTAADLRAEWMQYLSQANPRPPD